MSFKYVLIIHIWLFNVVLTQNIYPGEEIPHNKLNVALFFAKCSDRIPRKSPVLSLLEMHQIARIKNSIPTTHYSQPNSNIVIRNVPGCNELLKNSMSSLVHYCQNALGMRTAVTTTVNQETTNELNNDEVKVPVRIKGNKEDIRPYQIRSSKMRMANLGDIITSPEHKEVFKIRVKRNLPCEASEKPLEIVDLPLGKEDHKPSWDVLDIMAHIKFSFFGKLFENDAKKLADEENKSIGGLIQSKDRGLFDTVKTTLSSLQDTPDQAFLMVIYGGHLAEIDNKQSPLVQSIKHVAESTDPDNTLIALTCSCPEEEPNNRENPGNSEIPAFHYNNHNPPEVDIRERLRRQQEMNMNIPVFARGPNCNVLSQCRELYEIPLTIKAILEQISPSFGERVNAVPGRQKRSLVAGIRLNRKAENQSGTIYTLPTVIFYLCVTILFFICV